MESFGWLMLDQIIPSAVQDILLGLGAKAALIVPASNLKADLGMDSLDLLEIAIGFGMVIGRNVTNEESESFQTVSDLISFLERNTM